jgi:hypothetical protein
VANPKLNKLCKWRMIYAGWHNGTQSISEPGSQAMRDLHEKLLIMRAEISALATLMLENGVFTAEEFRATVEKEAELLDAQLSDFFAGFETLPNGIRILDTEVAAETQRRLGFPP